ncbi:hypothetical protein SCARD494_10415 [Seiridium cardinale]
MVADLSPRHGKGWHHRCGQEALKFNKYALMLGCFAAAPGVEQVREKKESSYVKDQGTTKTAVRTSISGWRVRLSLITGNIESLPESHPQYHSATSSEQDPDALASPATMSDFANQSPSSIYRDGSADDADEPLREFGKVLPPPRDSKFSDSADPEEPLSASPSPDPFASDDDDIRLQWRGEGVAYARPGRSRRGVSLASIGYLRAVRSSTVESIETRWVRVSSYEIIYLMVSRIWY